MQNNELYHYGVAGMKWGVRKKREYERTGYGRSSYRTDYGYNSTPRAFARSQRATRQKTVKEDLMKIDEDDSLITKDTYNKIKKGIATANTVISIAGMASTVYSRAINVAEKSKPAANKTLSMIGDIKAIDLIKKPE